MHQPYLNAVGAVLKDVEAMNNTTIKGVLRRARGMRDEAMLLLKLKWASARPIRSSRDLTRFLCYFVIHTNR